MPGKKHTKEQIIDKLRLAEKLKAEGATVAEIAKQLEVSEQTYYRYGRLEKDDVKRLRKLEKENQKLKKLVADLSLDKQILEEALEKKP